MVQAGANSQKLGACQFFSQKLKDVARICHFKKNGDFAGFLLESDFFLYESFRLELFSLNDSNFFYLLLILSSFLNPSMIKFFTFFNNSRGICKRIIEFQIKFEILWNPFLIMYFWFLLAFAIILTH